jgi:hypothetical protein
VTRHERAADEGERKFRPRLCNQCTRLVAVICDRHGAVSVRAPIIFPMPYYELKKLKRGYPPNELRPDIRPASDRGVGAELIEADDDDAAAAKGFQCQAEVGPDYIVTVSDVRDGQRVMIYPRKGPGAQEA